MDTDYSFWLCTVKADEVLTDRLPLEMTEDFTRVRNGASTVSFELHLNARGVPANIMQMLKPLEVYVVVVSEALSQPIIAYYLTDTPTTGDGVVRFEGTTFEGLISDYAYVPDLRFDNKDVVSEIGKTIGLSQEVGGAGMGLTAIAPPSGVTRTKYYEAHETTTVASALTALGLVWNIHLRWADADKTKFKKVLELALPTPVTAPPTLFFELGRNVATFDYAAPMSGGTYATRLTVRGDGTGRTRHQSATAIDAAAELRMHKRDIYLDIQGLTNVADCNAYLQQVKANYFVRKDAVTLTAIATNAARFEDIHNMTAVASVDIDSKALTFTETCVVGGWTLGSSLRTFTPTLIKLVDGVIKFPTSVDPAIAGKEPSAGKSDPYKNGVYIPKPGGGGYGITPSGGFGEFDSSGSWTPGAGGGGGGSAIRRAVVDTIDGDIITTKNGDRVLNGMGRAVGSGDAVFVTKVSNPSTDDGAEIVALGKGLRADGSMDTWVSDKLSAGFPHLTSKVSMIRGEYIIEDSTQALGQGHHTLITTSSRETFGSYDTIDPVAGETCWWDPQTSNSGSIPPPAPFDTFARRSMTIAGGVLYAWFYKRADWIGLSLTGPRVPYLHRYDKALKSWVLVPGLPTIGSLTLATGVWSTSSVQGSPDGYPTMVMTRTDTTLTIINEVTKEAVLMGAVMIWRYNGSAWIKSPWMSIKSDSTAEGRTSNDVPLALDTELAFSGQYLWFCVRYSRRSGNTDDHRSGRVYSASSGVPSIPPVTVVDEGYAAAGINGMLGRDGQNLFALQKAQVSRFDGRIYNATTESKNALTGNVIRARMPGSSIVLESDIYPKRDGNLGSGVLLKWASALHMGGNRYVTNIGVPQFAGGRESYGIAICDHHAQVGLPSSNNALTLPDDISGATAVTEMEGYMNFSFPTLQADGSVISHVNTSGARPLTASMKAFRFII